MTEQIAIIEDNKDMIIDFLGQGIDHNLFMATLYQAVEKNPKLRECTKSSFVGAYVSAAQLRLLPDGQDASIVPYGKKATFILGYFGALKLAYRNDRISHITAGVVYEEDAEFSFIDGTEPNIKHVKGPQQWCEDESNKEKYNPIIAAYAIIHLKDAKYPIIKVIQRWEIDRIRDVSPAKSAAPWVKWFPEMAMKTAIKQGLKTAPKSDDLMRAYQIDEVPDAFDVEFQSYNAEATDKSIESGNGDTSKNEPKEQKDLVQTIPEVETKKEAPVDVVPVATETTEDVPEVKITVDIEPAPKHIIDEITRITMLPSMDVMEIMTYMMKTYNVVAIEELNSAQAEDYMNYLSKKAF